MPPEELFISFTPGFNRVVSGCLILHNRFNGLSSAQANPETVETVRTSNATWITRLKPGENEMNSLLRNAPGGVFSSAR
jgi:hypothetical protein